MSYLRLTNVSLDFPVYNNRGRSLKKKVLGGIVGGRISSDSGTTVIHALRSISLEVNPGDRYALLGHNGAGKSTLLRVMAGIYKPTKGKIETEGKVTSMFDADLGISPEATGWENIETRGIILGLQREEMHMLRESVEKNSGLGEFLNMPVRTYSSGMKMRLAFCVSTAVKPEILLLDESVIAGDAGFLKMARARLDNLIADANILFLASHSHDILQRLCNKGVLVHQGQIEIFDSVQKLIDCYHEYSGRDDAHYIT